MDNVVPIKPPLPTNVVDAIHASPQSGSTPASDERAKKIEALRAALLIARDCVMESFEHAESTDDHYMAEMRLRQIDEALAASS